MGKKLMQKFTDFFKINKSDDEQADMINLLTYTDYYERLKLLALNMFEWTGLPEGMNERKLEETLYYNGLACFVFDEDLGFINLSCTGSGVRNVYGEPLKYKCYGTNYSKEFNINDNIVVIRNNIDEYATDNTIMLFSQRLYECERTISTNITAQKTPVLISCDENTRLTLKNVYKKFVGNAPVIFGNKSFDRDSVSVLKTDAPYVADKIQSQKMETWTEFFNFLGINNVGTEKKERLITDEVNANNDFVQYSAETMLKTRKEACEKFNKMFNQNISVKLRYGIVAENFEEPETEEGADNGKIYD